MENSDNNTQPQAQPAQKVVKKKKVIVGGGYGYGGGYAGQIEEHKEHKAVGLRRGERVGGGVAYKFFG